MKADSECLSPSIPNSVKKIYKLAQYLKSNSCFNLRWKARLGDLFVSVSQRRSRLTSVTEDIHVML